MQEILDNNNKSQKGNRKFRLIDLAPSIIILALLIWKIYNYLIYHYVFEFESLIAYIALGISSGLYFINKKAFVYSFAIILIFGFVGWFNLFPSKITMALGSFKFNPIALLILLTHLTIHSSSFQIRNNSSNEHKENLKKEQLTLYKDKLKDKTIEELKAINSRNGFREEVIQAAKELIEEKTEANKG